MLVPLIVSADPAHRHLADWQLRPVRGELGAVLPVPTMLLSEAELPGPDALIKEFIYNYGRQLQAAVAARADRD